MEFLSELSFSSQIQTHHSILINNVLSSVPQCSKCTAFFIREGRTNRCGVQMGACLRVTCTPDAWCTHLAIHPPPGLLTFSSAFQTSAKRKKPLETWTWSESAWEEWLARAFLSHVSPPWDYNIWSLGKSNICQWSFPLIDTMLRGPNHQVHKTHHQSGMEEGREIRRTLESLALYLAIWCGRVASTGVPFGMLF